MTTSFHKLNDAWNPDPNAPEPRVSISGRDVVISFKPNRLVYKGYSDVSQINLTFHNCARYRIGDVNDEGWYRGQCRFSGIAPEWGEFYKVEGDLKLDGLADWVTVSNQNEPLNHYLFYFRDEEFECEASGWTKQDDI